MLKKKRTLLCQKDKRTMKSRVSIIIALLMLLPSVSAGQQIVPVPAAISAYPRSEWLGEFSGISVNGVMRVHLIMQTSGEAPRIEYDTKGEVSQRFKYAIDKYGILRIEEPADAKRTTVTEVTVYCNNLTSLNVSAADLSFDTPFCGQMFDLYVSGGASVRAGFEVDDLAVEATGRSSVVLDGSARYMSLNISTAKFDGLALDTVSSVVDASHSAEVTVSVSERIQASTATSAKVTYSGNPSIVRCRAAMFGGSITALGN